MLTRAIFISVVDLNHLVILFLHIARFVTLQPTAARIALGLDHDGLAGFFLDNLSFIFLVQALNVYHGCTLLNAFDLGCHPNFHLKKSKAFFSQ